MQLVFDKFHELGSCRRLYRHLVRNQIGLGIRAHRGPRRGQLEWRGPLRGCSAGCFIIRSMRERIPTDVAASITSGRPPANGKLKMREVPMSEWMVLGRRPLAGLYHMGTVRGQPERLAPEQHSTRFSRSAP